MAIDNPDQGAETGELTDAIADRRNTRRTLAQPVKLL